MAFGLACINLYAYYKCRKDYHNKLKNLVGGTMQSMIIDQVKNKLGL